MSKTLSFRGGKAVASVFSSTGAAIPFPVFTVPATTKVVGGTGGDGNPSALYVAFTPSDTTVTINPTGENAITFTNATGREYLCTTNPIVGAYFLFAKARRKPGSTGAIVAQTVTISLNSVTVGVFNVAAATAGSDPVSGFVSSFFPGVAGDTRFDLQTYNLTVGVTAADSDLEIEITLIGYQD